jgi:hypothetical protein
MSGGTSRVRRSPARERERCRSTHKRSFRKRREGEKKIGRGPKTASGFKESVPKELLLLTIPRSQASSSADQNKNFVSKRFSRESSGSLSCEHGCHARTRRISPLGDRVCVSYTAAGGTACIVPTICGLSGRGPWLGEGGGGRSSARYETRTRNPRCCEDDRNVSHILRKRRKGKKRAIVPQARQLETFHAPFSLFFLAPWAPGQRAPPPRSPIIGQCP